MEYSTVLYSTGVQWAVQCPLSSWWSEVSKPSVSVDVCFGGYSQRSSDVSGGRRMEVAGGAASSQLRLRPTSSRYEVSGRRLWWPSHLVFGGVNIQNLLRIIKSVKVFRWLFSKVTFSYDAQSSHFKIKWFKWYKHFLVSTLQRIKKMFLVSCVPP